MPIRILITDDHSMFRSGLRALLEGEADFEIIGEAGTGMEAIRLAKENEFDVLLLDIGLPDLRGPKVAEEILKNRPKAAIIVVTMYEDEHYLQELFRIGVRGYVLKKSTGNELAQAIRAAHRGDTYVDPALAHLIISPYLGKPRPKKAGRLDILTPREQEICRHVAYGHTNSEVAEKLSISIRTVETHRNNIMEKLGLKNRAELVRFAIDNGLLRTD